VPDLMAALEASIAGAKRQGGDSKKPKKKASAGKKKATAKA
jgi:non-homologous end joining protein Ku